MNQVQVSDLEINLDYFTGTENYYRVSALHPDFTITDGVKYLAEKAGAYWLIAAILSYQKQCSKDTMLSQMQFWTLAVDLEKSSAVLTCERDKGDVAITQEIEYTDFPLAEIRIWVAGKVLMLPGEY